MGLSRFGILVVAALTVAGCSGGNSTAASSPSTSASSAKAAGPVYKASSLDLCNGTDIKPLAAELKLKVDGTDNSAPMGDQGSACLWRMTSADGNLSTIRVEAQVLSSVEEATRAFQSQQNVSVMKADAPISGLGDQAEGRTLDSDQGFKQSEYMVHLRTSNMTVKAWISVGGKAYTPKQTLAPKMEALARTTLTTVSSAWKQ